MAHGAAVGHWLVADGEWTHDLLHDGRARNVTEAILWHGGQAEKSREAFRGMSKEERAALVRFVESL